MENIKTRYQQAGEEIKALEVTITRANGEIEELENERNSLRAQWLELLDATQRAEDMSDPKNWRDGDYVKAVNTTGDEFIAGDIYVIKELKWIAENHCDVYVEKDSSGSRENGWGSNNFVWHSRPTK